MLSLWRRLNKGSRLWIAVTCLILFGLFQYGWVVEYSRPDRTFWGGWYSPKVSGKLDSFTTGVSQALQHHYHKGSEERLYLNYANLFLGHQHEIDSFLKHRGELGSFRELLVPPPNHQGPVLPYIHMGVEYPPVNIPFIMAPRLISDQPFDYYSLYAVEMGMLALLSLAGGLWIADRVLRLTPSEISTYLAFSALGLLALGNLFTTRLDLILTFFLMAALLAAFQGRAILSGALLALAAGAKLFPLLLVPLFAIYFWTRAEKKKAWHFVLSWTSATALIFIPWAVMGGERFWVMFWFHGTRPIQVETTYTSFLLLSHYIFGSPIGINHLQGSFNLVTAHTELFKAVSSLATLAMSAIITLSYFRSARGLGSEKEQAALLIRAVLTFLLALMLVSKVFSPQYLIWLWPLAFLVWDKDRRAYQALALTCLLLTQMVYPILYSELVSSLEIGASLFLIARNFTLLALAWLSFQGLWSKERTGDNAASLARWFQGSLSTLSLWLLAVAGLAQFLALGWWLWPRAIFLDAPSSVLGAQAFSVAQGNLNSVDSLAGLLYGALVGAGLDSVGAGIVFQQGSLLLLSLLLLWALRRALPLPLAVPLAILLFVGGIAESTVLEVRKEAFAAILSFSIFLAYLQFQERGKKAWLGLGLLLTAALFATSFTAWSGLLAVGLAAWKPPMGKRILGFALASFFALALLFTNLLAVDFVLTVSLLICGGYWLKGSGEGTHRQYEIYLLSNILVHLASALIWPLGPGDFVELKLAALLALGSFLGPSWPTRSWSGLLVILPLMVLLGRNPYTDPSFAALAGSRANLAQLWGQIEENQVVFSENSFVLTWAGQAAFPVEGGYCNRPGPLEKSDISMAVIQERELVFGGSLEPFDEVSSNKRYLFWEIYLRSDSPIARDLWENYRVSAVYSPFVLLRPKLESEKLKDDRTELHWSALPSQPDATFRDRVGRVYAFKGSQYWALHGEGIEVEHLYPRSIQEDWPGLPTDIDAAVGFSNVIYFFKDDRYWRWNQVNWRLDAERPLASGWKGLPEGLEAAAAGQGMEILFFKGGLYWAWDMSQDSLLPGYPKPTKEVFKSIPDRLRASSQGRLPGDFVFWDDSSVRVELGP